MVEITVRYRSAETVRRTELRLLTDEALAAQVRQRIADNTQLAETGCLLIQRWRRHDGYGRMKLPGCPTGVAVHRASYLVSVGPIPEGYTLDHLCHTNDPTCVGPCVHRGCVNPQHLEPVTHGENLARGEYWNFQPNKTHCRHGHAYTEANSYRYRGTRQCRECRRATGYAWRAVHGSAP